MPRPSFSKQYILNELDRLSLKISIPVEFFVIGGLGLIDFGLKEATKDIDVVVQSPSELRALADSLGSLGYRPPSPVKISRPYKKLLKALRASKEDIFLFKGITEREADLDDMRLLAESGLDWEVIRQECRNQSVSSGRLWENALLQNLVDLRDKHKIRSPIERTLERIVEERFTEDALIEAVKQGCTTVRMISEITQLPERLIRETANKMEKKGVLSIDRSERPYKFVLI
jgi:hypothetical protein